MTERQKKQLSEIAAVRFEEPMKEHITFRVGGPAEVYAEPTREELLALLAFAKDEDIFITVIGNGSNVLVGDEGLRGLVICIGRPFSHVAIRGNEVVAGAGTMLSFVAKAACEAGLSGLAFAGGIPGSVGGAVMMNAGAYGGEMSQVISSVEVLTPEGTVMTLPVEELDLSYRKSRFTADSVKSGTEREIVLGANFSLLPGEVREIWQEMEELKIKRREKQPLEYPSAGSTFKRPTGYFAGKLIEDAGLSGFRVGGACVSTKHCGFVVNTGGATASDILAVIAHVKDEVERNSGVRLEEEVRIL